ncbi:MAG: F0F1 ATP synthase subunit delta [Bacteroidales bacterium]|nr:F0F1 ATP synthase subunit delta [Bacteroidales bacterium]
MNEGLIPRRYAKALYKVAVDQKCDSRMYLLMQNLSAAFDQNHDLYKMVANPFVTPKDKSDILTTAAMATADDKTFADFLKLLEKNRRIDLMGQIAHSFVILYRKERNIRSVHVVSAAKLDSDTEQRIRSLVEKHLDGGTMEFTTEVAPDIIGGFIVNIDNERLDASLRNSLKELRLSLLK